jgi:broad specificity phosphatase PhoE
MLPYRIADSDSIDREYAFPDPPLTDKGLSDARQITIGHVPDLIIVSPMTRTIQTASQAFGNLISGPNPTVEVQVWPELREAHDAICNQGITKQEMMAKFPGFDFSHCHDEWNYPQNTLEGAVARAEEVRRKLRNLIRTYKRIVLVTHRGFAAFLVQGPRFQTCGMPKDRNHELNSKADESNRIA